MVRAHGARTVVPGQAASCPAPLAHSTQEAGTRSPCVQYGGPGGRTSQLRCTPCSSSPGTPRPRWAAAP
eukprot:scaffold30166_cov66-Phaeocystis_antarctica.AAC.1